jgi:hypothetical protein
MKVGEFKTILAQYPEAHLRFILPDSEKVPAHAHVTEVARIDKQFVDCGGTRRNDARCQLQTWVANDLDHRLTAAKLLGILQKAAPLLTSDELEVDIEHEVQWTSQFPLDSAAAENGELLLQLGQRHTACLAQDKCLPKPSLLSLPLKPLPIDFRPTPTTMPRTCCA